MLSNEERREIDQTRLLAARLFHRGWVIAKWTIIVSFGSVAAVFAIGLFVILPRSGSKYKPEQEPPVTACKYERRGGAYHRDYEQTVGLMICDSEFGDQTFNMTSAGDVYALQKRYYGPPIDIKLEQPLKTSKRQ